MSETKHVSDLKKKVSRLQKLVVMAFSYAYESGHHDTVEAVFGTACPEEMAWDWIHDLEDEDLRCFDPVKDKPESVIDIKYENPCAFGHE
jgi:hypothetical protein